MESIQNYEIYAYKQNATATVSDWKKVTVEYFLVDTNLVFVFLSRSVV